MLTTTMDYDAAATAAAPACAAEQRRIDPGEALTLAGSWGPIWRLGAGVLRLDRAGDRDDAMLALPGDLVGAEVLTGAPYHYTARALLPCIVHAVAPGDAAQRQQLLAEAMLQSHKRVDDVIALRSGPARQRVGRLQAMLAAADPDRPLPPRLRLKDCAAIVGATQETTCRVLATLRGAGAGTARRR